MATKSELERLAVLETQLVTVIDKINKIDEKLDMMNTNFVTKTQHDTDIIRLEKRIGSSSTSKTVVTVIATTTITALVLYFINGISR